MKEIFRQAINFANSKLAFIPFIALTGIIYNPSNITLFAGIIMILRSVLNIILYSIVYGNCTETVTQSKTSSWRTLVSIYWRYYFLAGLTIALVELILYLILFKHLTGILIGCLTIYVFPLVFLRQKVLSSIYSAVKIVFQKFSVSYPLMILVVLMYAIKFITADSAFNLASGNSLATYGIGYIENLLTTYIHIIIFSAATIILVEQKLWIDDNIAEVNGINSHQSAQ